MAQQGYLPPPPDSGSDDAGRVRMFARQISAVVREIMQGKMNVTATLTLTANTTTTILTDSRLRAAGNLLLLPLTANAAAALGTTYVLTGGMNDGAWTFTHANAATTDRTFRVSIIG